MQKRRSGLWILALTLWSAAAWAADVTVTLPANDGFAVKENTGTTERLRVDEATGNISRNGALFVHTTGANNLFIGTGAGNTSTTGADNTAFGRAVLLYSTTGGGNAAFGVNVLVNTTGSNNSAFGANALRSNTTGAKNAAFGEAALYANTAGIYNSAFGSEALLSTSNGTENSAFGSRALRSNTAGRYNSAFGRDALLNKSVGDDNVAIGRGAGRNLYSGSDNIYIQNAGSATDTGQIRIGTVGTHSQTRIAGIHGTSSPSGVAVLVNASGVLGTTTSSARFKQDVEDMGDASELLHALRPVTFRYRDAVAEGVAVREYGLIAEEVALVAPELVAYDLEGGAHSVRYHVLPALLLNELQEQQRIVESLLARIELLEGQQRP